MEITTVLNETRELNFEFQGQRSRILYYPNCYTLEFVQQIAEAGNDVELAAQVAAKLIADWELTENGKPLPPTAEGIQRLPVMLLRAIEEAIGQDMGISEEEKKGSLERMSSLRTVSTPPPPTSPNGSESSTTLEQQPASSTSPSPT